MSTLLTAEPEANFAQCSRAFSLQAHKGQDGHLHQVMLTESDMISEDFSSFQIRNFVSTVRRSDFSKCWPFRHKILEKCLSAGLTPFLPPFEPPLRGCDNRDEDHDISCARLQQKSPGDVSDEPFEESKQQDSAKVDRSDSVVFDERSLAGDKETKDVIGVDFSDKESVEINHPKEAPVLAKSSIAERRLSQGAEGTVLENSQVGSPTELVPYPNAEHSCVDPLECVDRAVGYGKMQEGMSSHAETITCAENIVLSTYAEAEAGSVVKVTGPSTGDVNGISLRKAQQHLKGKLKSLSSDCTLGEVQSSSQKSKSFKVGMTGKVHQAEAQVPGERLDDSDEATASLVEHDIVEMPAKNLRNAEDLTLTGLNLDILVPQVCPVCLNFTSTSNTALNAHIDHCLESVLPGEKGESRLCRNRIKPRKMRSMADICATAPARTLEDLEESAKPWALNDEAAKEISSCTPNWKSGLIRRQPRTSLHRGSAWKFRSNSDVEDVLQVSEPELQPQLEKSLKENLGDTAKHNMLWTAPRTPLRDTEVECEPLCPQPVFEDCEGPSHESSSIKLSLVRKKKKKQSTSVTTSKEVLTFGGSDEEQDDHMWSIPLSLLDFTPIDTSAEEERRLQQQSRCAKAGVCEAERLEQQGSAMDSVSRSGKHMTKQCSGPLPSIDTLANRSSNEIPKKRKRTQVDNKVNTEDVVLSVHSERPAKHRRAAPKIKSLLTLVAISCNDKGRDDFQKKLCPSQWQEKTNDKGALPVPSGLPNEPQEINFKQKSSASVPGERCSEVHKNVHFRHFEQTSTPDNLDSNNNLSEHAKSPKGGSVSSGRALAEHEMVRDCPPCAEEGMPLSKSAEKFGNRNVQGEEIGSLMSSLCQARVKDSCCALDKSKIANAKATTEDVAGKRPPFTLNFSGLRENGSSHCRSRFEYLRRAFLNVSSRKMCNANREEALRNTSHAVCFPEQAGKSHLLPSQNLLACSSNASASRSSNAISRENVGDCVPQLLSGSRKSFFPVVSANVQSVNNIRTSQMTSDSTATLNCHNSMTTDNQTSFANLSPLWSENSQLSAPTCGAKPIRKNDHSLTGSENPKNSGNCALQFSVKHGVQQACFSASDSFEQRSSNGNENSAGRKDFHISENGNLLATNRKDKYQGQSNLNQSLQRLVRTMGGQESPYQGQQEYFGSRFSTSELGPVHSSCLHESGNNFGSESNGHDCARFPELSTESASLSSSLLADMSRTMAGSPMNVQDPVLPSNFSIGEHPKSSNSCFRCTPKDLNRAREYLNLMPLQKVGNTCHPSASNGTMQPQLLHTALQTMKGHTSTLNSECVHRIGGNMDVSMKLCNTLSAISPYRVDSLNARESLLEGELSSNLNNYGTVEYTGDHGVVHIFGSPVFKLMGQNVIVTNSSIKALGMEGSCNQSGAQSFHPSSSITHLGVMPETGNHYSHNQSQELLASSRLAACHGDACMQRNHSSLMDSRHTAQSPGLAKPVHSKTLAFKESTISKSQMPQRILGERSMVLSTAREMIMKKPMVAHAVNKLPAEVFVDVSSNNGNSHSTAQSRCSGTVSQHNDRLFTANCCFLAPNGPLQSQVQSTLPLYIGDAHKLDVTHNAQYRSGTLADIVQSSERSNY